VAYLIKPRCRKPAGWLGRLALSDMNRRHSKLTSWGLGHVDIGRTYSVLDVGCGGGQTIQRLASLADQGRIYGVDYSKAAVAVSRELNPAGIEEARVNIRLDCVQFAVWGLCVRSRYGLSRPTTTGPIEREICWRSAAYSSPEGAWVIMAEAYRGRRFDWAYLTSIKLLRGAYLSPDQHRALLQEAGYVDSQVFLEKSKGWICAVGTKPW
jgi:SAM-dependent methyltransferase